MNNSNIKHLDYEKKLIIITKVSQVMNHVHKLT